MTREGELNSFFFPNLKSCESPSPTPSPSASLGGGALISSSCFTPNGHRLLFTPAATHSPQTHSSRLAAWRPPPRIPAQARWNPRSHPSHTTRWWWLPAAAGQGLEQAAQLARPPLGTAAGAPGGGPGLS